MHKDAVAALFELLRQEEPCRFFDNVSGGLVRNA
jgi:hypothetical protein